MKKLIFSCLLLTGCQGVLTHNPAIKEVMVENNHDVWIYPRGNGYYDAWTTDTTIKNHIMQKALQSEGVEKLSGCKVIDAEATDENWEHLYAFNTKVDCSKKPAAR